MGHTLKLKAISLLSIAAMVLVLGGGGFLFKDGAGFNRTYVQPTVKYLEYKAQLANMAAASNNQIARSVPVLVYHGVVSSPDESNVKSQRFVEHMFALKRAGYQTISLQDLYDFMSGKKQLPDKSFLLTFDDGRKDSYYDADPVLRALDYKAVMFVISRYSLDDGAKDSNYYLSRAELSRMQASGRWDIQAHTDAGHTPYQIDSAGTLGHFYSNKLWLPDKNRLETDEEFRQRITTDFAKVKQEIEKKIGDKVTAFAFPFGDFGEGTINYPDAQKVVMSAVNQFYVATFHQFDPGRRFTTNYPVANDPANLEVKRITVEGRWTADELLRRLSIAHPKSLPFEDDFSTNRGWVATWSNYQVVKNQLVINPFPTEQGAGAVLDGTKDWMNYELTATVVSRDQSNVYSWVRFQDDNNNLGCNIGKDTAQVVQILNGATRIIKGANLTWQMPAGEFEVGVKVYGRTVECSVNGQTLVTSPFADPSLDRGGVGFKTWSPVLNAAGLTVKHVKVTPIS